MIGLGVLWTWNLATMFETNKRKKGKVEPGKPSFVITGNDLERSYNTICCDFDSLSVTFEKLQNLPV